MVHSHSEQSSEDPEESAIHSAEDTEDHKHEEVASFVDDVKGEGKIPAEDFEVQLLGKSGRKEGRHEKLEHLKDFGAPPMGTETTSEKPKDAGDTLISHLADFKMPSEDSEGTEKPEGTFVDLDEEKKEEVATKAADVEGPMEGMKEEEGLVGKKVDGVAPVQEEKEEEKAKGGRGIDSVGKSFGVASGQTACYEGKLRDFC